MRRGPINWLRTSVPKTENRNQYYYNSETDLPRADKPDRYIRPKKAGFLSCQMSARPGLESEIPMSTLMSNAFIKIGDTSQAAFFGPTNTPHDALTIQAVQLDLTDPESFPPAAAIRFILT